MFYIIHIIASECQLKWFLLEYLGIHLQTYKAAAGKRCYRGSCKRHNFEKMTLLLIERSKIISTELTIRLSC